MSGDGGEKGEDSEEGREGKDKHGKGVRWGAVGPEGLLLNERVRWGTLTEAGKRVQYVFNLASQASRPRGRLV
jgi:hypothetical protein